MDLGVSAPSLFNARTQPKEPDGLALPEVGHRCVTTLPLLTCIAWDPGDGIRRSLPGYTVHIAVYVLPLQLPNYLFCAHADLAHYIVVPIQVFGEFSSIAFHHPANTRTS